MLESSPSTARAARPAGHAALARCGAAYRIALAALVASSVGCVVPETEVRAQAANDLDCARSSILVEAVGASAYRATGCGLSEQYTCAKEWVGQRLELVCGRDVASASTPATAPPAAPPPLLVPPSGAGGFAFGASEGDVRRTCEQAGHAYAPGARGGATCDGVAADVSAPARATFGYCGGVLCAISLQVRPAQDESIGRAVARWKGALVERYGGPSAAHADAPAACLNDVTPCVLDRTAAIGVDWAWSSRQHIWLTTHVDDARQASLVIAYVAPAASATRAPGL